MTSIMAVSRTIMQLSLWCKFLILLVKSFSEQPILFKLIDRGEVIPYERQSILKSFRFLEESFPDIGFHEISIGVYAINNLVLGEINSEPGE